jgi:hypothetical protein
MMLESDLHSAASHGIGHNGSRPGRSIILVGPGFAAGLGALWLCTSFLVEPLVPGLLVSVELFDELLDRGDLVSFFNGFGQRPKLIRSSQAHTTVMSAGDGSFVVHDRAIKASWCSDADGSEEGKPCRANVPLLVPTDPGYVIPLPGLHDESAYVIDGCQPSVPTANSTKAPLLGAHFAVPPRPAPEPCFRPADGHGRQPWPCRTIDGCVGVDVVFGGASVCAKLCMLAGLDLAGHGTVEDARRRTRPHGACRLGEEFQSW